MLVVRVAVPGFRDDDESSVLMLSYTASSTASSLAPSSYSESGCRRWAGPPRFPTDVRGELVEVGWCSLVSFGSGFPLVCVMVVVVAHAMTVVVAVVEGLEGVFRIQPLPPNAGTTGARGKFQLRLISDFFIFLSSAPALV